MIPGRAFTNQVQFIERNDHFEIFLPAYLRMTFKKITEINLEDSSAAMIATVILTVYHKNLPEELKADLTSRMILTIAERHALLN